MICSICGAELSEGEKVFYDNVSKSHYHYTVELKPYDFPITRILEDAVDKYGVDTSTIGGEKTAAEGGKCPICGADLDPNSPTPKCPTHGTAPFEGGDQVV